LDFPSPAPAFVVQVSAGEGLADATRTAMGPKVRAVTLKWQAALLFGGQLILVGGGVVAMLLLQQAQEAAGASAGNARHAQVLEAKYFAGMTQAESGLQEYIDTGDIDSLPPQSLPEIAFVGRSNAGKSTAINALARRTRERAGAGCP